MSDERLIADRYRLGRQIGAGGMGRVWLGRDEMLGRSVAIKEILLPRGMSDAEAAELRLRTLREARTAARLRHPNVTRIYDVLNAEDRPWIVMEYVPSRSLSQIIKEDGTLTVPAAARVGLAVLEALCAAHASGVVHRDVKPANVLIGDDGRVVLTDFGLATFDEHGAAITLTGVVHGSPHYIAPERALDGTAGPAGDMWSLGATLYMAVEGRAPYARGSSLATLAALAKEMPDPPRHAGALQPVLGGLLRRDPQARTAPDEVRAQLRRIINAQPDPEPEKSIRRLRGDAQPGGTADAAASAGWSPRHAAPRGSVRGLGPSLRRRTADFRRNRLVARRSDAQTERMEMPAPPPDTDERPEP